MKFTDYLLGGVGIGFSIFLVAFIIIASVLFFVAVARMAKRYGRSAALYVIISFFATPFGAAFILYCSGETEEHRKRRMREFEEFLLVARNSRPYSSSPERSEEHDRYMPR